MQGVLFLVPLVGVVAACAALCMSRARYYRAQKPTPAGKPRPRPPRALSEACCRDQSVVPEQLTIHSDRGAPMTAKSTALLYVDLGSAKSQSRPYTSNDNPYSEANFRTLKYRPDMPSQLGSVEHARQVVRALVAWYTTRTITSGSRSCTRRRALRPRARHRRRTATRARCRTRRASRALRARPAHAEGAAARGVDHPTRRQRPPLGRYAACTQP